MAPGERQPRFRCYPAGVSNREPNGKPGDCRLDLSDTEAVVLCLSCGGRYVRELPRCTTCGAAHLVPRARLAAAVRRSAPNAPPHELERLCLVQVLAVEEPEALDAIRRGMTAAGFPHVVVSAEGALLESGPAAGSAVLFAAEDDEPSIRERLATWLPDGAEDVEREPGAPVALETLVDAEPLAVSHSEFEANLIRGELDRAGIAFACVPGGRGLQFFVASADVARANELLDLLEGKTPEGQPIAEEELERLALAESSIDDGEAEPDEDRARSEVAPRVPPEPQTFRGGGRASGRSANRALRPRGPAGRDRRDGAGLRGARHRGARFGRLVDRRLDRRGFRRAPPHAGRGEPRARLTGRTTSSSNEPRPPARKSRDRAASGGSGSL